MFSREKKAERKTDQFSLLNAVILSFLIHGDKFVEILYHSTTRREFSFKIYPENMVVVVKYNTLNIFTMHTLVKLIKLILYFIEVLLINEKDLKFFEILTTTYFQGKF